MKRCFVVIWGIMGQSEALDCYNQQLQGFAVEQAEIQTNLMRQSYEIIEKIDDPIKKAEMYKKVMGDCCDVPQSGCGCITCKDKE